MKKTVETVREYDELGVLRKETTTETTEDDLSSIGICPIPIPALPYYPYNPTLPITTYEVSWPIVRTTSTSPKEDE